jgi:hypothetical protein
MILIIEPDVQEPDRQRPQAGSIGLPLSAFAGEPLCSSPFAFRELRLVS